MQVDYKARRVARVDGMQALRFQARAGVVFGVVGILLAAGVTAWMLVRLDRFEAKGGAHGVWAVIDKCGNSYEFDTLRPDAWDPAEQLYVDKLQWMIECTRGMQFPTVPGAKSCWPRAYEILSKESADKVTNEFLKPFGNGDVATAVQEMQKVHVEITWLPGAVRSADGRYRLYWRETERNRQSGSVTRSEVWSGVFTVTRVPATPESVAAGNAIGLRVETFSWQQDKEQG